MNDLEIRLRIAESAANATGNPYDAHKMAQFLYEFVTGSKALADGIHVVVDPHAAIAKFFKTQEGENALRHTLTRIG